MRKLISLCVAAILIAGCLSACSFGKNGADNGKLKIVTTIFPEYDWIREILGDRAADAEITLLLDNGVDLHSYQPTAADILKISECDLFVYVGGESDRWVENALRSSANKDRVVVNLLEALGSVAKEEELLPGMQEEEHDHDHEDGEDHDHEHEEEGPEYDEHVWLSLRNAEILVKSLADALTKADSANAETYKKNAEAYIAKLKTLDEQYKKTVSEAPVKTLLFGDRFPFRYFADDYGLTCYAAFSGCSAESEASFETIAFLSQKVDELSLHTVMTIEGTDHRIADTIIRNTNTKDQKILTLNSLQSATSADIKNGVTYLSVMEQNLSVLKEALR